jgi:hypothetical protein
MSIEEILGNFNVNVEILELDLWESVGNSSQF